MDRPHRTPTSLPRPPRLRAEDIALFLDVDGTLLELASEPDAVQARLRRILKQLQSATGGALG